MILPEHVPAVLMEMALNGEPEILHVFLEKTATGYPRFLWWMEYRPRTNHRMGYLWTNINSAQYNAWRKIVHAEKWLEDVSR